MATKKKAAKPETAKAMKARHLTTLAEAYRSGFSATLRTKLETIIPASHHDAANRSYAELRAVVYAITPGRQKARNIGDLLDKAVAAAARVIRRRT